MPCPIRCRIQLTLDYDSAPGPDGRVDGDSDTHSIFVPLDLNDVTLSKRVVDSSADHTGSTAHDSQVTDLAIGETASFEIVATIGEGSYAATEDIRITDQLPDFLAFTTPPTIADVVIGGEVFLVGDMSGITLTTSDSNSDGIDDQFELRIDLDRV